MALTVDAAAAGGAAGAGGPLLATVLQSPSAHCAALLGVVDHHATVAHVQEDVAGHPNPTRLPGAVVAGHRGAGTEEHTTGGPAGVSGGEQRSSNGPGFRGSCDTPRGLPAGGTGRFLEVSVRGRAGGGGGAAGMAEGWARARPPTLDVAVQIEGLEVRHGKK